MSSMVIVQLAGFLGADPEVKFTPSGQKLTAFRIATNIKRGEKEVTQWWRITVWGDRFDKFISYLKKGSFVYVIGHLGIPTIYTDKNGNQQISLEVTAEMLNFGLGGNKSNSKPQQENGLGGSEEGQTTMTGGSTSTVRSGFAETVPFQSAGVVPGAGQANFVDDDIPF